MKRLIAIFVVLVCVLAPIKILAINTDIQAYEYYKQQLNSDEKIIYNEILNALKNDNFANVTVSGMSLAEKREDLTQQYFALNGDFGTDNEKIYALFDEDDKYAAYTQNALDAFVLDHTEYYWLDVSATTHGVGLRASGNRAKIVFEFTYSFTLARENYNYQSDYPQIMQKIASITSKSSSRFEQVKAIHNYICQQTTYIETTAAHDASGPYVNGKAVCQGYADAFKMACDYYSIPCVCVSGTGNGANGYEAHMWNYVQMENGVWYAIDVTWDDQTRINYDYFLCGSQNAGANGQKAFFTDHQEETQLTSLSTNRLVYPQISKNAYVIGNSETPVPTKAPVATPIVTPVPTAAPTLKPTLPDQDNQPAATDEGILPDISLDFDAPSNKNDGEQEPTQAPDNPSATDNAQDEQQNEKIEIPFVIIIPIALVVIGGAVVIVIVVRKKEK